MSRENVEIVRQGWDAWIRGDVRGVVSTWDSEIVLDMTHWLDWPEAQYHGAERVLSFLNEWLDMWDNYEAGVEDVIDAPGDRVVALYWHRGQGRDSGLPMEFRGAQVLAVRNGKLTRVAFYGDRAEALEAVGLRE